ncbi:hypothetical protein CCHR01_18658 [Colletotrichum chrysophilum]|uniref:Uncharacterized protein n=1 Tax=Colletotrichum chrysophilum TaxID=1836956 RepID=A0AAD9A217_9PEZI|nr:hypothetical protein CCHR01_18658 [Colletotrichum chrysophilum]
MRRCRHGTIDYLPTSIMACCSRCRSTMWTWTSRALGAGGCGCLLPAESTSNGQRACMSFEDRTRQDDSGFARCHSLMTIAKDSIRIFRRGVWTPESNGFLREWNRRDSCKTASVACPTESSSKSTISINTLCQPRTQTTNVTMCVFRLPLSLARPPSRSLSLCSTIGPVGRASPPGRID